MSKPEASDAFSIDHVGFLVGDPAGFDRYSALHWVATEAFQHALPTRSEDDIRHLLGGDLASYRNSRRDPQLLRYHDAFNSDQRFSDARMVVAEVNPQEVIGYGYAANNVSGRTGMERQAKYMTTAKRWAWIREIAVLPDAPRGTGTAIAALLLDGFKPKQPVSAYTWEEDVAGERFARRLGLERSEDPTTAYPFGQLAHPAQQYRWAGKVADTLITIEALPGAREALAGARQHIFPLQ